KNEQGYLFLTRNNTFITSGNFCDKWKRILRKINKYMPQGEETNITPHYFRHNYATDLIYAGVSPKTVQYIMGHEKADITMNVYADIRVNNKDVIDQILKYNNKSIQNL
ncbi:MAG: tyrosine-type recombinase/integrase, partial [bacterium]|nr:tyrosine-type recombinase/integrase [bacterium]